MAWQSWVHIASSLEAVLSPTKHSALPLPCASPKRPYSPPALSCKGPSHARHPSRLSTTLTLDLTNTFDWSDVPKEEWSMVADLVVAVGLVGGRSRDGEAGFHPDTGQPAAPVVEGASTDCLRRARCKTRRHSALCGCSAAL